MSQKKSTVSLTIGFFSADPRKCHEDALNLTEQLSELLGKFQQKSETISETFITHAPVDVPADATMGKSVAAVTA